MFFRVNHSSDASQFTPISSETAVLANDIRLFSGIGIPFVMTCNIS